MLYGMLISLILTFLMLGIAKRLPDPYWTILLHMHESTLALFLFFAIGMVMRSISIVPTLTFRGKRIPNHHGHRWPWPLMLAFLMAVASTTYRYWSWRAYAAFSEASPASFNPWEHRGNVFAMTLALLAATISLTRLQSSSLAERLMAYTSAMVALVSFAPLLMPAGFPAYHPVSMLFVLGVAVLLFVVSRFIQRRWRRWRIDT